MPDVIDEWGKKGDRTLDPPPEEPNRRGHFLNSRRHPLQVREALGKRSFSPLSKESRPLLKVNHGKEMMPLEVFYGTIHKSTWPIDALLAKDFLS